jgi:hypothetical protein
LNLPDELAGLATRAAHRSVLEPIGIADDKVIGTTDAEPVGVDDKPIGADNDPMMVMAQCEDDSTSEYIMMVNGRMVRQIIRDSEWIQVCSKTRGKWSNQQSSQSSHKFD